MRIARKRIWSSSSQSSLVFNESHIESISDEKFKLNEMRSKRDNNISLQWLLLIWFFFILSHDVSIDLYVNAYILLLYWLHFKKLFYIWCIKNIYYLKIEYFDWYETFIDSKITSKIFLFRDKIIIYLDLTSYFFNLYKANLSINIDR